MCIGEKIYPDMIKLGEVMCQFVFATQLSIILYTCKSETIRNQLISYLAFLSVIENLETSDQLTSYWVKVHSTT